MQGDATWVVGGGYVVEKWARAAAVCRQRGRRGEDGGEFCLFVIS